MNTPERPSSLLERIEALVRTDPSFSDIHLREGLPMRVRESGRLSANDDLVVTRAMLHELLAKVSPHPCWSDRLGLGGGQWDFSCSLAQARLRCNLHRCDGGQALALVMRRLDACPGNLEALGLPLAVREFVERRAGLMLVTGPTGAGKSTTLSALVDHINGARDGKIITIEDPIEILHVSRRCTIVQREVGTDVDSFSQGLRAAFRQDPDVILIGEIRDRDTMETALAAAEAGHLVLATLHTLSAAKTVDRIADFFSGEDKAQVRGVLASVLLAVIGQVLLPREDGAGRVLAWELMEVTPAIASLIRDGRSHQIPNAISTGASDKLQLLNRSLAQLVRARLVSLPEARRASYDPRELDRELADRELHHV